MGQYAVKYLKGGESVHQLKPAKSSAGQRYNILDNGFGEYYVIHHRGDLRICDRDGEIAKARAIE